MVKNTKVSKRDRREYVPERRHADLTPEASLRIARELAIVCDDQPDPENPWAIFALCVWQVLQDVHDTDFACARGHWREFTAWDPVEYRALVAEYHLERCAIAMRHLRQCLENYAAAARLERMSVDERSREVLDANALVRECLCEMEAELGQ